MIVAEETGRLISVIRAGRPGRKWRGGLRKLLSMRGGGVQKKFMITAAEGLCKIMALQTWKGVYETFMNSVGVVYLNFLFTLGRFCREKLTF